MVIEPVSVSLALVIVSRYPLGFCVLMLPRICSCSSESVGEPKSGSAVPELVLPSCAPMALTSEL